MTLAIGVDIGGTKVAAGVVDEDGGVLALVRRPTPGDVAGTEDAIADCVAELADRYDVVAVGIGAAGWIANDRATVLFSPHLAWRDEPLKEALAGRIGFPVTVENDANAAAWAEYRFGAARGERVVCIVTLGTGIGGGLVVSRHALPRCLRSGGRVGPHAGGAGRPALRLRQPRLLGDVRVRHRAGPGRPRAGRGLAGGRAPAAGAGRWRPGRADRHAGDHRGPGG